jgi:hypothetical protein
MLDFMEDPFFIHSNHTLVVTYMRNFLASFGIFSFDISNELGVLKRVERA